MSDTVLIALIVAVTLVVVLYMFRRQLSNFVFRANKQGVEAQLSTRQPDAPDQTPPGPDPSPGVVIRGNVQRGRDHKIQVGRDNVQVRDNLQEGQRQEITAGPDNNP
jgi:hypothetical protein